MDKIFNKKKSRTFHIKIKISDKSIETNPSSKQNENTTKIPKKQKLPEDEELPILLLDLRRCRVK